MVRNYVKRTRDVPEGFGSSWLPKNRLQAVEGKACLRDMYEHGTLTPRLVTYFYASLEHRVQTRLSVGDVGQQLVCRNPKCRRTTALTSKFQI